MCRTRSHLADSWTHHGPTWGHLGVVLRPPGAILAPLGAIFGHLGVILVPLGAILGHLGDNLDSSYKSGFCPTKNRECGAKLVLTETGVALHSLLFVGKNVDFLHGSSPQVFFPMRATRKLGCMQISFFGPSVKTVLFGRVGVRAVSWTLGGLFRPICKTMLFGRVGVRAVSWTLDVLILASTICSPPGPT